MRINGLNQFLSAVMKKLSLKSIFQEIFGANYGRQQTIPIPIYFQFMLYSSILFFSMVS